jgi:hypothetical protein
MEELHWDLRAGVMRRQMVSTIFAGLVALMATPMVVGATPAIEERDTVAGAPTVAVQRVAVPGTGLRDEAAMVLIGTALIGLAAMVRRTA